MENVFDHRTIPDEWHPCDYEKSILQDMFEKGRFGNSNSVHHALERVELGIASGVDKYYLSVMLFLNSFRE